MELEYMTCAEDYESPATVQITLPRNQRLPRYNARRSGRETIVRRRGLTVLTGRRLTGAEQGLLRQLAAIPGVKEVEVYGETRNPRSPREIVLFLRSGVPFAPVLRAVVAPLAEYVGEPVTLVYDAGRS